MNTKKTLLLLAAVGLLSCSLAQATMINGTINFTGDVTLDSVVADTEWQLAGFNMETTTGGTGDYASVPNGTPASFTDFRWNKTTLAITSPAAPFTVWTFNVGMTTYSFILDSPLTAATAFADGMTHTYNFDVTGSGIAQITGFDDTAGTFHLQGSDTNARLEFFATGSAVGGDGGDNGGDNGGGGGAVPEGGSTVALLGLALAGAGSLRRVIR